MEWKVTPGSKAAQEEGCTCPVLDNGHGRGRGGDGDRFGWVVSGGCPIHRIPAALSDGELEDFLARNSGASRLSR